jgi:DNA-binding HxlR family transcriptional regulator
LSGSPELSLDGPARGSGFLALLADGRTVALMEAVRDRWLERAELEERLGYGGKAFGGRARRLERMGLLVGRPLARDRRKREWLLADCGRELLEIGADLALVAAVVDASDGGVLLRKLAADPWDRAIVRLLLDAPQPFNALLRLLNGIAHTGFEARPRQLDSTGLSRRLGQLEQLGLVCRQPAPRRGAALYAPGKHTVRLARVAVRWALWRWTWTPERVPRLAGDLLGLVKLLSERAHVAADAGEAVVLLHVRPPEGVDGWPDVVVALAGGRISVLDAHIGKPHARVRLSPRAWCEALHGGDFDGAEIEGDVALARSLLAGLAVALAP